MYKVQIFFISSMNKFSSNVQLVNICLQEFRSEIHLIYFFLICLLKYKERVFKLFFSSRNLNFVSVAQKLPFKGFLDETSVLYDPLKYGKNKGRI